MISTRTGTGFGSCTLGIPCVTSAPQYDGRNLRKCSRSPPKLPLQQECRKSAPTFHLERLRELFCFCDQGRSGRRANTVKRRSASAGLIVVLSKCNTANSGLYAVFSRFDTASTGLYLRSISEA